MFCPKCGAKLEDHVQFCHVCGTNVGRAEPAAPPVRVSRPPDPFSAHIRAIAQSPLLIIGIIAFSISTICSILSALSFDFWNLFEQMPLSLSDILQYFPGDIESEIYHYINLLDGAMRAGAFMLTVPSILMAVGMWMTLYSAITGDTHKRSNTGLQMMRVVIYIQIALIVVCPVLLSFVLLISVSNIDPERYYLPENFHILLIAVIVTLCILCLMIVCYYKGILNTLHAFETSLRQQRANATISEYAAVMSIILGSLGILAIIASPGSPLSVCLHFFAGIAQIFFGIFLFVYRNHMEKAATR